ncbi:Arc family DNA-binding protein [Providencia alcalifaciens]|uniref:Arc family DNA-binding protein n=1 Tax=Providencia alcalifaciens TaxID=126385 RepID=UPI000446B5B6|nr:Arc family DNA-binding protein [Providencia alcalifaciens]EUD08377.1 HicB family protein [Providencia alcalifaciens R90-1475]
MKDELYTQKEIEKLTLRLPKNVKNAVEKKAREEGLSLNSAIIQRLVWSINNDKYMQCQ